VNGMGVDKRYCAIIVFAVLEAIWIILGINELIYNITLFGVFNFIFGLYAIFRVSHTFFKWIERQRRGAGEGFYEPVRIITFLKRGYYNLIRRFGVGG